MQEKERVFLARADRVQYGVFICKTVGFADAAPVFVCDFGVGQMVGLRGAFQQFGTEFDLTFLREGAHVLTDFCSGFTGTNAGKPRRIRCRFIAFDDVDHLTVPQFARERRRFTVDLAADSAVAEVGMDLISKVHGSGALGQLNNSAARGENVNAIREDIDLDIFHELQRSTALFLNFQQAVEPVHRIALQLVGCVAVAVKPVRCNTVLTDVVHFFGTNLELDHEAAWADNGRMQTLVTVRFRNRHEVFETTRNRFVELMDDAQSSVAVVSRRH